MIKKSLFEDELIQNMQKELDKSIKKQAVLDLNKAINYLYSAADILESEGLSVQSKKIMGLLEKIASEDEQDAKKKPVDRHTKGLNSNKMIANLKNHGTVFNLTDDGNDLNNLEIGEEGLEVKEKELKDLDFEDEI